MSQVDGDGATSAPPKRKATETRSKYWDHFEKTVDSNGRVVKAKCKYCKKTYAAEPKRHGTATLKNHSETRKSGYPKMFGRISGLLVHIRNPIGFMNTPIRLNPSHAQA